MWSLSVTVRLEVFWLSETSKESKDYQLNQKLLSSVGSYDDTGYLSVKEIMFSVEVLLKEGLPDRMESNRFRVQVKSLPVETVIRKSRVLSDECFYKDLFLMIVVLYLLRVFDVKKRSSFSLNAFPYFSFSYQF